VSKSGISLRVPRKRLRNRLRDGESVISLASKQVKNYLNSKKQISFLL
jgi:hypothetical protein